MSAKYINSDWLRNYKADRHQQELFSAAHASISQEQSGRTISKTKEPPVWTSLLEIHQNICSPAIYDLASRTPFLRCLCFNYKSELFLKKQRSSPLPPNSSRYKIRRGDPLHHSVCCPLNTTIIMKSVILAVLLLLAVASLVSGAPAESGKWRYGHATCLVVILQTL